nr:transporter substrate-binding protein [Bacillus subtilis]
MKAGILHSLRGTVAISEVTVHDTELMAIVGFSVSWRTAPQTGLHAMLPVAEQNNGSAIRNVTSGYDQSMV